jgi:hypothetical protein
MACHRLWRGCIRDIYDLRVRGFDDDSLRRLLFDCDLRIRRETARGLGFSARNV